MEPATIDVAALAADVRVMLVQLGRRLREQSPDSDLTPSQQAVLGRIEQLEPTTAAALAQAQGMRAQSMAAIVAALDAAGYVSGTPDPRDGRKTLLSLTDAAREQFRTGRLARQDWLTHAIVDTLDPDETAALAHAVDLLRRVAQA